MSRRIPESELILNPDGSVYHLNLKPENLANTVIIVGDPKRSDMVSGFFERIEYSGQNRELRTHTGQYKGKRITVISTGMGTDNIDIVLNELDALVNVDLKTRMEKSKRKSLNIIRLGTSGALQEDIPVNSTILSLYGFGMDGLLNYYNVGDGVIEKELTHRLINEIQWPEKLSKPYLVKASPKLVKLFDDTELYRGITATAPGFYGPQGRVLRLPLAYPDLNEKLRNFSSDGLRILNFEMETSALYGLGKLLGHHTLTLCIAIASRTRHNFNQNYHKTVFDLTGFILDKLLQL